MTNKRTKIDDDFAKRLTDLMSEKSITVREAATICDIPTTTIQGWRSGTSPSSGFDGLARLAHQFGCSLEYLLTGKNLTEPGVSDVLVSGGAVFDGYVKVRIEKVIPRREIDGDDDV